VRWPPCAPYILHGRGALACKQRILHLKIKQNELSEHSVPVRGLIVRIGAMIWLLVRLQISRLTYRYRVPVPVLSPVNSLCQTGPIKLALFLGKEDVPVNTVFSQNFDLSLEAGSEFHTHDTDLIRNDNADPNQAGAMTCLTFASNLSEGE
jgi:hypothetical protein